MDTDYRSHKTVWLINPYGPIPGEGWRDYRFTIIGTELAARGYQVVWWTSSFSHHFKKQRCQSWEDRIVDRNFRIRLVPSPAYSNNIGAGRIWRDIVFGWRTYNKAATDQSPALIIFSENPLCLGLAGYRLGRLHRSKMVFDQMDLWPEIIEASMKPTLLFFARPLLGLTYLIRARIYKRLDGSMALAKHYLNAMHQVAPVLKTRPNCVAYNGINVRDFRERMMRNKEEVPGVIKSNGDVWAIFAGSLGETYDIRTLLAAGGLLAPCKPRIRILLAGDGPLRNEIERHIAAHIESDVIYLGKLSTDQLARVYNMCDIGLCSYSQKSNVAMPDKIYDYTAAGLAVLNSLSGEASELVRKYRIGVQYIGGDSQDLAHKLVALAADLAELDAMKRRSRALGESFDSKLQMRNVVRVVETVLRVEQSRSQCTSVGAP